MLSWVAIYKDNTIHPYSAHAFSIDKVDLIKLDKFQIKDLGSDIPYLQIHFDDPRKRLIYIRRTENISSLPEPLICHIVGWQMLVGVENIQNINYVFETIMWTKGKDESGRKHMIWQEQAGKFDRRRDSRFYAPSDDQLAIIGSKAE